MVFVFSNELLICTAIFYLRRLQRLKKSQKQCNKAAVSCIFFSQVVTIKWSAFLWKTSDNSIPHERGAVFSAVETIITINSVDIRSIKKRELINVYREDIQSIIRKQRPFPFLRNVIPPSSWVADQGSTQNLVIFFQESVKQKIRSLQQCASNGRKRFIWKLVLQKGTSSRCVLFIHKLSKHDHGAAEVQTSS